jgi:hypothetical protein
MVQCAARITSIGYLSTADHDMSSFERSAHAEVWQGEAHA